MTQLGLFQPQPIVLAKDGEGGIVYSPNWIPATLALRWFEELKATINWRHERRQMYEREVDVPRLVAGFDLDDPALPAALQDARERLAEENSAPFTSVGLNFYRDGQDSVAPHNDRLEELERGQPIVLISLGSVRRMTLREKRTNRRPIHIDLEPGSLLLMSHASQSAYLHGIPKTDAPVGPRISAAFRVRPAR